MKNKLSTEELNDISETMLIPVWARAQETHREDAILKDPIAVEVIQNIDYDFSVFNGAKMSQAGCCIRGKVIDAQTRAFLNEYPDAVVIQLGGGLDTRFERLGCPEVTHWYDLDLPQATRIREKLCPKHSNNTLIASSLFDYEWIDTVKAHNKPVLIIIEGVLMYFDEPEVKAFFNTLCEQFETATVLFDMLVYMATGNAKKHDAVKRTQKQAEFKWSLLNTKDMQNWHDKIHIKEEQFMSDYAGKRFPLWLRLMCKTPWGYKRFNQRMIRMDIA